MGSCGWALGPREQREAGDPEPAPRKEPSSPQPAQPCWPRPCPGARDRWCGSARLTPGPTSSAPACTAQCGGQGDWPLDGQGRAQSPARTGHGRAAWRGSQAFDSAAPRPVPSPPSWAPGWTSTRRTSTSPRASPASSSWWPTCSSTCLARTWSAARTCSWLSWRAQSSRRRSWRVRRMGGPVGRGQCWTQRSLQRPAWGRPGAKTGLGPPSWAAGGEDVLG